MTKMTRNQIRVLTFFMSAIMFSTGMIIWFTGKQLYGSDASLIWASGILTYLALKGLADVFFPSKTPKQEQNSKEEINNET